MVLLVLLVLLVVVVVVVVVRMGVWVGVGLLGVGVVSGAVIQVFSARQGAISGVGEGGPGAGLPVARGVLLLAVVLFLGELCDTEESLVLFLLGLGGEFEDALQDLLVAVGGLRLVQLRCPEVRVGGRVEAGVKARQAKGGGRGVKVCVGDKMISGTTEGEDREAAGNAGKGKEIKEK